MDTIKEQWANLKLLIFFSYILQLPVRCMPGIICGAFASLKCFLVFIKIAKKLYFRHGLRRAFVAFEMIYFWHSWVGICATRYCKINYGH